MDGGENGINRARCLHHGSNAKSATEESELPMIIGPQHSFILEKMMDPSAKERDLRQMGIHKYFKDLQFTMSVNCRTLEMTTRE
jgi:hypothetical protein